APVRPGAALDPEMDAAREAISDISTDIDDTLIYALYPQTGLRFLNIKHGLEPIPDDMKPRTAEQQASPSASQAAPADMSPNARRFNVYVQGQRFEVDVDPSDAGTVVTSASGAPAPSTSPSPSVAPASAGASRDGSDAILVAPMPGMLVSIAVKVGQTVSAGETLVVLEAMKMQNSLPAPIAGTVKELPVAAGTQVAKDEALAIIAP
ncbi:MAG: biotin/lipoyl-containing protein, partial [SAR202 cluster bacterium]|nr:biotin/lipoyl-containing protein [SAR202 cluster bacterium]